MSSKGYASCGPTVQELHLPAKGMRMRMMCAIDGKPVYLTERSLKDWNHQTAISTATSCMSGKVVMEGDGASQAVKGCPPPASLYLHAP